MTDELERLRAENKRLRDIVRTVAECDPADAMNILPWCTEQLAAIDGVTVVWKCAGPIKGPYCTTLTMYLAATPGTAKTPGPCPWCGVVLS